MGTNVCKDGVYRVAHIPKAEEHASISTQETKRRRGPESAMVPSLRSYEGDCKRDSHAGVKGAADTAAFLARFRANARRLPALATPTASQMVRRTAAYSGSMHDGRTKSGLTGIGFSSDSGTSRQMQSSLTLGFGTICQLPVAFRGAIFDLSDYYYRKRSRALHLHDSSLLHIREL